MGRVVKSVVLVLVALLWLVPSYLIVVNAFTPADEYTGAPHWWIDSFGFGANLKVAFETAHLGQGMLNSLVYAVVGSLLAVLVAALASFAVVVMPVRRPSLWFWGIYVGTVLPLQSFLSPLFTGYARVSFYDTQYGMVLVYVALCVPFAFFVVRNYMTALPRMLMESAQLDGAGWFRIFWRIHLPLSRSALAAAFIFQFTWIWNDLLFGLTLSTSANIRPVMATLAVLNSNQSNVGPTVVLAGALLASLPTIVIFFAFQRLFVRSLRLSA